MSLAILDGGTFYHAESIQGARFRDRFDRVIYAAGDRLDLEGVRLLIVPDRIHAGLLRRHRQALLDFAGRGGTLVVFAENAVESWLPGAVWAPRQVNFWWWLDRTAVPPHEFVRADHEWFRFIEPRDCIWHFHGVLTPPSGADIVVAVPPDPQSHEPGGALVYDDRASTAGRVIVTTLDPFFHHGSHFMPATTRFLDGFLAWARAAVRSNA